jgi:hypothetical protein
MRRERSCRYLILKCSLLDGCVWVITRRTKYSLFRFDPRLSTNLLSADKVISFSDDRQLCKLNSRSVVVPFLLIS